jgi:cytochrome P450
MGREGNEFLGETVVELDGPDRIARRQLESPLLSADRLREYERSTLPVVVDVFLRESLSGAPADEAARIDLVDFGLTMEAAERSPAAPFGPSPR